MAQSMTTTTAKVIGKPLQAVRKIRPFSEIPGPRPSLPLVGTNWQYWGQGKDLFQLHKTFEDKLLKYGPICKEEYQFRRPVVHLFDADHFPILFRSQGNCPIRPPIEFVCKYRRENPDRYPGVGLSNAIGEEWHQLRSVLAPVLKQIGDQTLLNNTYGALQWEICEDWVQHLGNKSVKNNGIVPDIQDSIYMLALESIFALCLERRLGCFTDDSRADQLVAATKKLFNSYQRLYYGNSLWKRIATKPYRDYMHAEETIYRLTSDFLAECSNSPQQSRMLCSLMSLPAFTWKDIQLTVMDFVAGGVFSLTQTLTFFIHQLAVHKSVQANIHNALQRKKNYEGEKLASDPYIKACLKETFRLSPSVPGIMRVTPVDTVICDYHIPAGTAVFANSMIACRNEDTFERPLEYLPERWLNGRSRQPFAVLPFGFGARMCVGRHFAELEMCSAVAALIRKFKISSSLSQIPLKYIFVIAPDGPVPIKMQSR